MRSAQACLAGQAPYRAAPGPSITPQYLCQLLKA